MLNDFPEQKKKRWHNLHGLSVLDQQLRGSLLKKAFCQLQVK